MIWCIVPVVAGLDMTEAAIADLLAQSIPTRILIVNQAVNTDFREHLEKLSEEYPDRVFVWSHEPMLPSLAATWNCALKFCWQLGETDVFVVNNDVRLHPKTVEVLQRIRIGADALFVSAVGVTSEQFDPTLDLEALVLGGPPTKGGPDFSCFLITRECHTRFWFDENFIPAFCEDLDYHRRLMLAGEGKRIFSVNLPYLHLASQTLKQIDPEQRRRIEASIEAHSRRYYIRKWGGPVNQEKFFSPFDEGVEKISTAGMPNPPTTPDLQKWSREGDYGPPLDELTKRMLEK